MAATSPAFTLSESPSRIFLPSTSTWRFLISSIDQLPQLPSPVNEANNFNSVLDLPVEHYVWGHRKVPKALREVWPRLADFRVLAQAPRHFPKTLDDLDGCQRIAIG